MDKKLKGMRLASLVGLAVLSGAVFAQTATAQKEDARDRVQHAKELYKEGKLAEALGDFEQLSKEHPESVDIEAWLGFLYLQSHRPQDAIAPLEMAASKRPDDLEINSNLGSAYLDAHETDKALEQYKRVERLDPHMPQAAYNVGTLYLSKKDYANAITAFHRAVELDQQDAYGWNNLGYCYEAENRLEKAAPDYARAASIKPEEVAFSRNAGLAFYKLHNYATAMPFLEKAYHASPSGDLGLALAECYTKQHRLSDAAGIYDALKDSESGKPAFWFNLGYLKQESGDTAGAEEAYRKCLELDGNDLDSLNNLGMLLYKRGDYARAEVLFDKLSGLNPSSYDAKHNLAVSAMKAGDADKALQTWRELVRANPAAVEPRVQLADALYQRGDLVTAKYHYNQALLQDPKNAAALNGTGLLQLHDTKWKDAAVSFRAAIASKPHFVPAYNNLALVLEKLNKRAEAIKVLTRAHTISPDDQDVNRNLDRMKAAQ